MAVHVILLCIWGEIIQLMKQSGNIVTEDKTRDFAIYHINMHLKG